MEDARETVRKLQDEVFGHGRLELLEELVHEDFVNHTPLEGVSADREGLRSEVRMLHAAASQTSAPAEKIVVDGDLVAWRYTFRGKHTGAFMGIPASGNDLAISGIDFGRVRDGKLAEWWSEVDMMDVMTQLGALG